MSDISVEFSSAMANKVTRLIQVPHTVTDKREKFDPRTAFENNGVAGIGGAEALRRLEAEAQQKGSTEWARDFQNVLKELRDEVDAIDRSRAAAAENGREWFGPTQQETDEFRVFGDWDAAFHCAWIKVVLMTRPNIRLSSPRTSIVGVDLMVSATGEAWAKHPAWKCVKTWKGICYKWKKIVKWSRLASLTKRDVRISADANIQFLVGPKGVLGEPRFSRLRLDYPIFKEIPLESLVNYFLSEEDDKGRFSIISMDELSLSYFGKTLKPTLIALPPAPAALRVDVDYAMPTALTSTRRARK